MNCNVTNGNYIDIKTSVLQIETSVSSRFRVIFARI